MTKSASELGYYPLKEGDFWIWQEAIADCLAYHYVLPSQIFRKLKYHEKYDGSWLRKYYRKESDAIFALYECDGNRYHPFSCSC